MINRYGKLLEINNLKAKILKYRIYWEKEIGIYKLIK